MNQSAYSAYAQSSFGGIESPTKLIEMLYDGILKFIFRTKKAIEAGDIEKKVYYINRTNAIFVELLNSLDYSQGDMANIQNDVAALNEVTNVVKQLSEAWREVTSGE